jgi:hypothetical protein
VRQVGYKFVAPPPENLRESEPAPERVDA